ncbi:MAG: 4Fe-4S dicluster domain-containing protein [bacterium]
MEISKLAYELLEKGDISLIIGYEENNGIVSPCFIKDKEDTKRLIFNDKCFHNLSVYLTKMKERVGIIAKGCDIRSIIGLVQENQIKREDVVIIGIACPGLNLKKCSSCPDKNPKFYDYLIGEKQEEIKGDKFSEVIEIEKKNPKERWNYFKNEFSRCIRCYACRQICPLCYCETCIVDVSIPQWISKANSSSSNFLFHITRALHLAGRCVGCGECERVCPMKIPLSLLNLKIANDVLELFDYKAGEDVNLKPPLQEFKKDDYNEFIG